jgi:putative spermidine/putrescine transport system permease protein
MSRNGPVALAYHALFVVFMLAPIAVVCAVAFTPESYLSIPTRAFSFRWFMEVWRRPDFLDAFITSACLGVVSATIGIAIAVPAALAIGRYRFSGRDHFTALFMSPLMIPHVVLGVSFLRFFTQVGLGGTMTGLVLSHIVVIFPFALRLVLVSVFGMDQSIDHAAISLGASDFTTFRRVTLPLILPGIVSGWALAFITSFDDVTMTIFIASPRTVTLPVRMFQYVQDSIDPLVTAVAACVIATTVVIVTVVARVIGLERLLDGQERG